MSLTPEVLERFRKLASIRGEPVEATLDQFDAPDWIRKLPRTMNDVLRAPVGVEFVDAGVDEETAYVELSNGRRFFGYPSNDQMRRTYEFLADLISPAVSAETFRLALDVAGRYANPWSSYPTELLPGAGGTVVEVGAYLGHKTVYFHDELVGPSGFVLAIEAVPSNFAILCRNVEENNLGHSITTLECGVWSSRGAKRMAGAGFQRYSLVEIDGLPWKNEMTVATDTLDNILANSEVGLIDFLDIRVNGAEEEVLHGLSTELERVKIVFIAAPYLRAGARTYDRCVKLLRQRGSRLLEQSTASSIYAVSETFAGDFERWLVKE